MTQAYPRFDGKTALVTGAGSGIGKTAALSFAAAGASVVAVDRHADGAESTAREIARLGGQALPIVADVAKAQDVARAVGTAVDRFGRLDCAFNNAGILGDMAPIADMTESQFDEVVAINLKGVWLCIKYEVEAMMRLGQGGAIVNTSSFLSIGPAAGTSAYAASKAALNAMIQAIALETGPAGIRINNVAPGVTDTPMLRAHGSDEALQPFANQSALKRLGQPRDIANAALWLCSDHAGFVTGQSLLIDGGYTIGGIR